MNIEELKQELLNASVEIDLQGYGQVNVIFESDFNELVEKLANKLSIHDVVGRSEQLKDKETPTFEAWLKMNNYELYKNAEYKDENDCSWFTNELLKMYERELIL